MSDQRPDRARRAPRPTSTAASSADAAPPHVGWTPMVIIALGIALFIMDSTIVNVSLPAIIRDLRVDSIDAEWVQAIYALVFAAVLIVVGRVGDRFGRRRVFVAGATVFGLASVLAATSGSGTVLIAARALQGLGGAMMSPSSLSIVNATYRGARRTTAFAIYGSVIGGMAAVGPLLGGYLTEHFSWRWSFGINVPIALAIVVGAIALVPESRDESARGGVDVAGAVLSALGIGSLVFGLIEGRSYGWWTAVVDGDLLGVSWSAGGLSPIPVALGLAVVSLVGLWWVEARRTHAGRVALIDVRLFRIPSFGFGSLAALILSLGEFGILFALPLFLQGALGYTALGAGAVLAALAAGSFVSGPTTPMLARRFGPRWVARLGMALEVVGILGLGLSVRAGGSAWPLVPWLLLYGAGVGYASAQLTGVILADVPVQQSGQASGTQSTARQVGSALGTAVLGTILFVGLSSSTESRLADVPGFDAGAAEQIAVAVQQSAGTVIPSLAQGPGGQAVADAAAEGFADALRTTALLGSGFVALGLLATLALPRQVRRPEDDEAAPGASSEASAGGPQTDPDATVPAPGN